MQKTPKISISLEMGINFMTWFRGVFYHLPRHKAQNIKRTEGGYHQPEGLWDSSIYTWSNSLLVTSTWVE